MRIVVAATFRERWTGLRPRPRGAGLWLRGSSVHSFGMKEPLWICGLHSDNRVLKVRLLKPGRVVWLRGAKAIVELPIGWEPPPVGAVITWSNARDPDPLCQPDRQPS